MIKDDKLQQEIGWYPHKGQKLVLGAEGREVVICAGRRWGKSAVCGYIIVKFFLNALNEVRKGERESIKIWIVAPTYDLTSKVFEYVSRFLLAFDKSLGKFISGGTGRPYQLKISESIWIQCKSTTEPMSLLGEELDLEIIDEAARIPERIFQQYIYPTTIAKSRECRVYVISTPKGNNWFKKLFLRLKEEGNAFKFTTLDGVETDENRLEDLKATYPDLLFKQEYMAEFVDDAGTVFKDIDSIVGNTLEDAIPNKFYTIGIDLGTVNDYTVMTVVDRDTNRVVHIDRFKGIDYPLQKQHIKAKALRYNNARIIIDATGVGKPIYEDLRQEGLFVEDFTFSGKSKEELIGKLIVFAREKYIQIPNNEVLLDELRSFQFQLYNERGEVLKNIKYEAPKGSHDDCVMSLALAVWGLNDGKPNYQTILDKELLKAYKIKRLKKTFI